MMSHEIMQVGAPVAIVPGLSLAQRFAAARREYPYLPDPAQLVRQPYLVIMAGIRG